MNRAGVWLLSLVTPPDRALTTVGDFAEESREHGRLWFWLQIARTFGAHLLREFTSAPGMLLLGIAIGYLIVFALAEAWVPFAREILSFHSLLDPNATNWFGTFPSGSFHPLKLLGLTFHTISWIVVGASIARFTQRTVSTMLLFLPAPLAVSAIVGFIDDIPPGAQAWPLWFTFLSYAALAIGAIWQRRRSMATRPVKGRPQRSLDPRLALVMALGVGGIYLYLRVIVLMFPRITYGPVSTLLAAVVLAAISCALRIAAGYLVARTFHRHLKWIPMFLSVWASLWLLGVPGFRPQLELWFSPALLAIGAMWHYRRMNRPMRLA